MTIMMPLALVAKLRSIVTPSPISATIEVADKDKENDIKKPPATKEGKDNENNSEHDDDDNNKYFTVANQDLCKWRKRDAVKSSKCYNWCLNLHLL